jgi:low affinity Fe/Cu permease
MKKAFKKKFEAFATKVTKWSGSPGVILSAFLLVFLWAITGPFVNFSEIWQLAINTGTTIITFLMVFVIQHSQNKDTLALHLKIDELLSIQKDANSKLINIEDQTEDELDLEKEKFKNRTDNK